MLSLILVSYAAWGGWAELHLLENFAQEHPTA